MALIKTDQLPEQMGNSPMPQQPQQFNPESLSNQDLYQWLAARGVGVRGLGDLANRNTLYQHLANYRNMEAQKDLQKNQLIAADQFMQSVPTRIDQEVNAARTNITRNLVDQQRDMRGQAASSGMLHSGRRQKIEGELGNQAAGELAGVRGDVINRVVQQGEDMYGKVLGNQARSNLNALRQQANMASIKQDGDLRRQQQFGQGMGLIGQGIGYAAGSRNWFNSGGSSSNAASGGFSMGPQRMMP